MLTIDHIQKHYPNFKLDLSLTIPTRKITGVLGPNGAGKTTFFKLLLNLTTPDHGTLTINNQPLKTWITKNPESISATFPDSGFNENLTITEINQLLKSFYPNTISADFLAQCQQLNLSTTQPIKSFSTGMQAKLKLLIALSHKATLLVLDEPTTGLDVTVRQTIIKLIKTYHYKYPQATILISSHIASDIDALAENVILITDGTLQLQEDLNVIKQQYGIFTISHEQFLQVDNLLLIDHWTNGSQVTCLTANRAYFNNISTIKAPSVDDLLLNFTGSSKEVTVA